MKNNYSFLVMIEDFLANRIVSKYNDIEYLSEERNSIYVIKIFDKSNTKIKLTFVFWANNERVSFLIDDYEIIDEEFHNINDLILDLECIISNIIIKTEKFVKNKLIYRQYEYSTTINGNEERIKDERKFGLSWFSTPNIKLTKFSPW